MRRTSWRRRRLFFRTIRLEIEPESERVNQRKEKVKHLFLTAEERNYQWARGVKTGTYDETFREYAIMKEMHWSWDDLENIPEVTYASFVRIMNLEAKERAKESKNAGRSGNKLGSKRSS